MKFTIRSASWGDLTWEDGAWTGDRVLIALINAAVRRGSTIPTILTGPSFPAADDEGWKAWYTARWALRDVHTDGDWRDQPPAPPELFELPENALG